MARKAVAFGPGWLARGVKQAGKAMHRADPDTPADLVAAAQDVTDPIDRARRYAEIASPVDMLALIAIRHGLDPDTAETYKHQLRLIADIASRSLSIVGLRAGEVQQFEVSDRFREFLERWQSGGQPAPVIIDGHAERVNPDGGSLARSGDTLESLQERLDAQDGGP